MSDAREDDDPKPAGWLAAAVDYPALYRAERVRRLRAESRLRELEGELAGAPTEAEPAADQDASQAGGLVAGLQAAVAEAQSRRAQLEAVFQAVTDGIAVTDMAGSIVYLNQAEARVNGYATPEEMLRGLDYFGAVYELRENGRLLSLEEWPVSRVLRGESLSEWQLEGRRSDTGQTWVFSFSGEPVRDARGRQNLAVIVTRDITAHRGAEEHLRARVAEIESLNERLLRTVAESHHRIRSSLQAIAALADLQAAGADPGGMVPMAACERVGRHARAMAAIHGLLSESAAAHGDARHVSARAALETLLPEAQKLAGSRTLSWDVVDAPLPVRQATALAVLVNELVSCAVHGGRGAIGLRLGVTDGVARLEVWDDGTGPDSSARAPGELALAEMTARWDLRGDITLGDRPGGGAQVVVTFPTSEA